MLFRSDRRTSNLTSSDHLRKGHKRSRYVELDPCNNRKLTCSSVTRSCKRRLPDIVQEEGVIASCMLFKKRPPDGGLFCITNYFLINKLFPVISFGCSIPISSISVGAISAKQPPSRKVYSGSAFTRMNGTGFVV